MTLPTHDRAPNVFRGVRAARRALLSRVVSLLLLFAAPLLFTLSASAQPATKKVLILSGSDPNHPGFSLLTQRVRSILRDGSAVRVELLYELQEGLIKPPDSPHEDEELVAYLKRKYEGKRLDLIFSGAAPRLKILLKNNPDLFQGVPKVFYDYEEEREATYRDAGPHITGVWARVDMSPTLDLAFALQPEARRVVVVAGNTPEGGILRERARAEFRKYEGRAEFVYLSDLTLAELKARLAALPRDNIVYYLSFYTDRVGNRYPGGEALSVVAPTSGAPIYGNAGSHMGSGLVGGSLTDLEGIGQRVGEVCLRILNGERPEDIPSQTAPNALTFDWRELKRWGISEEKLPPGSVVKYRGFSFWELYKWYIIGSTAASIIEALLIAYLLIVQRRRRLAERERERLSAQVETEHRRLDETVSNVPGIVWETLIDPKTDERRTAFISDYVEKMLGYTSEEWMSLPAGLGARLMPRDDREAAARVSEEVVRSGKEAVLQHRWRTKDGRLLWVESHLSPVFDGAGKVVGLRGVSIDITEQKQAEEARRRSEERNLATLRAIPDLMFLQTREGVYLDYHARDAEQLYVPPETFIGKNIRDVVPPELAEKFLERFALVDESGDPQVVEYDLEIGGKQRWYEARLVRSGEDILSVVRDITERKTSEEALRQSESRLRMAQEAARVGTWERDLRTGRSVWSEMIWQLLGLEPGDGKATLNRFAEFIHPEDRERVLRKAREIVAEGEEYSDEFRIVQRDGRVIWVASQGAVIRSPDGRPERMVGVNIDITERKRAEVALREAMAESERNRAQLESIFYTVADGIMVSDMAGNVLLVNEAMARIHQYESTDGLKANVAEFAPSYELFDSDGRLLTYEEWPLSKVLRGEAVIDWEVRVRRTDIGREWFFSYSGEPVRNEQGEQVLGLLVTHDITERKRAEEALRQSEGRFREMADTAPVMIWIAGKDQLSSYFNKQWLAFTGRGMAEELGNGWTEGIHPEDYARCIETYTSSFARREPFKIEYRLRRADGAYRWLLDTGTPRFASDGEFLGFIGSAVDINDRKESEESLRSIMEELHVVKNQLQEENVYLREEIKLEHNFSEIVGGSDAIKYVLHKIEQVAPTDSTVLITGETGTGKELAARAIHSESHRHGRPLVKLNCAALSPTLIESELFGHERGAFTGAAGRKVGRFELADGATIFLDEIGELPLELQAKLLRVIQEGEFERLGSTKTLKVDVRIIAATNRNLWKEVQAGTFREDLFYRLNIFPVTMPPLRQHPEDIPLLVEHFVGSFSRKMGKKITAVTPSTLNALCNYAWPGNIRELANVIERAVINNNGPVLQISHLAEALSAETPSAAGKTLEEMERDYIVAVLNGTGWRIEGQHGAARILGLHPSTLRTRMAKLKVLKPQMSST